MREILIAEKTPTSLEVLLLDVSAVKLRENEARCKTEDGFWITVDITCVREAGSIELHGLYAVMKTGAAWPVTDGLFALSRDGRWLEARRQ